MKPIELRAYSPVNKEMYYDVDPNYHFEIWGTTIDYTPHVDDDSLTHFSTADDKDTPEYIQVTEFTGILCKDGKKIFEHDIIKFHYFYAGIGESMGFEERERELIGVVEWGEFGWGVNEIVGNHWQEHTGYKAGEGNANFIELIAMNEHQTHEESFEILGNVYENPELLNP